MKIITNENHLEVYTPYNKDFIARIKFVGGSKWNRTKGCWDVPTETLAEVRKLMFECYGENDISATDYVTVKLTFNESMSGSYRGITMFGKTIARAYDRDTVGTIDTGVVYTKGHPMSGGSRKRPLSWIEQGTEIVIHNVPKSLLGHENIPEYVKVEIVTEEKSAEKTLKALMKRKQALMSELEELDEQIKKTAQAVEK